MSEPALPEQLRRLTDENELLKEANRQARRRTQDLRKELGDALERLYALREELNNKQKQTLS